jgi:hypothetical protein
MNVTQPLELPDSFDSELNMPATETDHGRFHITRSAAALARRLVDNGTDLDLRRAQDIIEAVIDCQELRQSDPHHGNFPWMAEDGFVADLNAVEFILGQFVPMLCDHRERLERISSTLLSRLLDAIRAGLDEIVRLDVHIGYTNIAVFDIHNSILGGELLDEASYRDRGIEKLVTWSEFTATRGHPFEYNSPTYTPLVLRTLDALRRRTQDSQARTLASTMLYRLALSVALRLHAPTGRMAGPHGRGYNDAVRRSSHGRGFPLFRDFEDGPRSLFQRLLGSENLPRFIEETASPERGFAMTTLLSSSYSLGTASTPFMSQSNVLLGYVGSGVDGEKSGDASVFYTRYLTNDHWFGDFYHSTDRSTSRNLLDEGLFHGVQEESSVIAAYAPTSLEGVSEAKAVLVWSDAAEVTEILVGDRPVNELPASIGNQDNVGVAVGTAYFVVRPLARVGLGEGDEAVLRERDGSLLLELVQYRGAKKDFWELRWPGGFYQGKPINAFYLEVAESSEYDSLGAFVKTVAEGAISEELDPPRTFDGVSKRMWKAEYRRGSRVLGMAVELNTWSLAARWNARGEKAWPPLDVYEGAPARRSASHKATGGADGGDARITCAHGPAWIYGDSAQRTWYAGFIGSAGAEGPVELVVPGGSVRLPAARWGWIFWEDGEVTAEASGSDAKPVVRRF